MASSKKKVKDKETSVRKKNELRTVKKRQNRQGRGIRTRSRRPTGIRKRGWSSSDKQYRFKRALAQAKKILDERKVPFHLSSGTCLGYYRTGKFLNHDQDIDLGIFSKHYTPGIVSAFKKGGFKYRATYGQLDNGLEFAFRHRKTRVKLDLIFYYDAQDYFWSACYKNPYQLKDQIRYKHSPFQPQLVKFMGLEVRVPPVTYIEEYYHPWRIPVKGKYRYWQTRNSCRPKEVKNFKGYLVDRSWQQEITIGIKTFMRPENLSRCLKSLRKFYPEIPVMVADDSTDDLKKINRKIVGKYRGQYVELPFDSGLSKGRNEMVRRAGTKYYITVDDDSIFLARTDFSKFYKFLEKKPSYQVIGGRCLGRPSFTCRYSHFSQEKNKKILYYWHQTRGRVSGGGCRAVRTDRMQNFFMARTDQLAKLGWDEELKLGEHNNFFVRAWQAKWKLAFTEEVKLDEKRSQNSIYQIYRNRRQDYANLSYQKTGKTVKLDRYLTYQPKMKKDMITKKVSVMRKYERTISHQRKGEKKNKIKANSSNEKIIQSKTEKLLKKSQRKFKNLN